MHLWIAQIHFSAHTASHLYTRLYKVPMQWQANMWGVRCSCALQEPFQFNKCWARFLQFFKIIVKREIMRQHHIHLQKEVYTVYLRTIFISAAVFSKGIRGCLSEKHPMKQWQNNLSCTGVQKRMHAHTHTHTTHCTSIYTHNEHMLCKRCSISVEFHSKLEMNVHKMWGTERKKDSILP